MQAGIHAQQHAWGVRRFGKETMHGIAKNQFQAKGHTTRTTAYAAGQIDEQGVGCIHHNARLLKLRGQSFGRHGIAQEKIRGVFIIHKVATRVLGGLFAALLNRHAVVGLMFDYIYSVGSQFVFFPLAGIGRHMDADFKAQLGAHDANRQAQIAGGTDGDGVLAEKGAGLFAVQLAVVVRQRDQTGFQCQILCMFQDFMDAATGFDGTGNRKFAIRLQPQGTHMLQCVFLNQRLA